MVTETRFFREDYWDSPSNSWRKLLNYITGAASGGCNTIPFIDASYDSRFCFGIDIRNVMPYPELTEIAKITNGMVAIGSRVAAIGETVSEFNTQVYTPPKTTGIRSLQIALWTQVWSPQQVCGYGGSELSYRGCGCTPYYPTTCSLSRFLTEDLKGATLEATEWTVRYRIQKTISVDGYAQWSLLWIGLSLFAARIANFSYTPVSKRLLVGVGF